MKTEQNIAFKEWASIVNALAQGKQILILRKGGIREDSGEFQVEHDEFFLFPTYEHQNKADLKPDAHEDLDMLIRTKPDASEIPIRYFAKVTGVFHLTNEGDLTRLEPYHVWSEKAVNQRFHYGKEKGVYVIAVRIYRLPYPHLIPLTPEYAGCKSWVYLKEMLSTEGAKPVLSDEEFKKNWQAVSLLFPGSPASKQV